MQYYYSLDGTTQRGPLEGGRLREAGVNAATMVWREGMPDWQAAGSVPELAGLFPPADRGPPPFAGPPVAGPPAYGPPVHGPPSYGDPGRPVPYATPGFVPGTNGMAVASLVLGVIGVLTFCCFLPAVLAIVFGHVARGQTARGHGTGRGLATAGLVLGYLAIVLALLGITFRFTHGNFYYNGRHVGF